MLEHFSGCREHTTPICVVLISGYSRRRQTPHPHDSPSPSEDRKCPSSPTHLYRLPPRLLLIRLSVTKRKPTHPLIRPSLPTDPPSTSREKDTPQRDGGQEARPSHAQSERNLPRRHVLRVGIESRRGVEGCRESQRRDGVRRFGVGGVRGCAG